MLQVEKELKERAGADADAAFEAAKQTAAESATAEAEAALAAQREQYEAAVAAAEVRHPRQQTSCSMHATDAEIDCRCDLSAAPCEYRPDDAKHVAATQPYSMLALLRCAAKLMV